MSMAAKEPILATRIEDMDFRAQDWVDARLNTRIRNALQRAGIHTVAQLVQRTKQDLIDNVQGCGIVGSVVIGMALRKMGLDLRDE